ncbi:hypothetical protein ACQ86G_28120 [Roseateles chitinivorans]
MDALIEGRLTVAFFRERTSAAREARTLTIAFPEMVFSTALEFSL